MIDLPPRGRGGRAIIADGGRAGQSDRMPIEFVISYDMRAPDFGAKPTDLYAAALDQVEWADELGFHSVGLGEHHCSPDGYNPSPIPLACAMAGRSKRILFRTSVLLAPLYDLVKLAEDLAVVGEREQRVAADLEARGTRLEQREALAVLCELDVEREAALELVLEGPREVA